jgi:hypothetical protein
MTKVEDEGTTWTQRSSELGIAPASMVERQWLRSSGWPTRVKWRLSCGDPDEVDIIFTASLELDGDP